MRSEPTEKEPGEVPISTTAETSSLKTTESQEVTLLCNQCLTSINLYSWFCTPLTNHHVLNIFQVSKETTAEEIRAVPSPTVQVINLAFDF